MKLRSDPDTVETKRREIGMYKSPLPSSRKRKASSKTSKSVKKPKGMSSNIYIYIYIIKYDIYNGRD